jgi:ribonuclease HII
MSIVTNAGYKLRYKDDDAIEVGLDEAGRGCLFGRLYVGAVVFSNDLEDFPDNGEMLDMIKDSKKLSAKKRDLLYDYIIENALDTCVAYAEVDEIDRDNILQADLSAMHRALDGLNVPVERVLADGDHWRPYPVKEYAEDADAEGTEDAEAEGTEDAEAEGAEDAEAEGTEEECKKKINYVEGFAIVDGDAQYLAIAAAGILAKVSRDRWVADMVAKHPEWETQYGLGHNMGYGTAQHMKGLVEYGATAQHRTSFAPVRAVLGLPLKEKKHPTTNSKKWAGVKEE